MVSDVLSAPSTKKSTRVAPTLSVALAVTATLPETVVPSTGAVTYATGAVVSLPDVATVTVTAASRGCRSPIRGVCLDAEGVSAVAQRRRVEFAAVSVELVGRDVLVHFTVPSIRKSTELTVVPLGVAVHVREPVSVAPLAILEVTTKEDGGARCRWRP